MALDLLQLTLLVAAEEVEQGPPRKDDIQKPLFRSKTK